MSEQRWRKVELRRQYVTPMGINEEVQQIDRDELQEEHRELLRAKLSEAEGLKRGMSSAQRRQFDEALAERIPDPDTWELENFNAYVLEEAQKWGRLPVIVEAGERLVHVYPPAQVLRVTVDVREVIEEGEEEEETPALEVA